MSRKMQTQVKLDREVQEAIFSMTLVQENGKPATLGSLVDQAIQSLKWINTFLESSPIMKITAENLLRTERRTGNPVLKISPDGEIFLKLVGEEDLQDPSSPLQEKLPSLDNLRNQAREMGVDISDLGRQKINILKRLRAYQQSA